MISYPSLFTMFLLVSVSSAVDEDCSDQFSVCLINAREELFSCLDRASKNISHQTKCFISEKEDRKVCLNVLLECEKRSRAREEQREWEERNVPEFDIVEELEGPIAPDDMEDHIDGENALDESIGKDHLLATPEEDVVPESDIIEESEDPTDLGDTEDNTESNTPLLDPACATSCQYLGDRHTGGFTPICDTTNHLNLYAGHVYCCSSECDQQSLNAWLENSEDTHEALPPLKWAGNRGLRRNPKSNASSSSVTVGPFVSMLATLFVTIFNYGLN